MTPRYAVGSRLVFLKQQHGTQPPRGKARAVHAAPKGEIYDYVLEKCRVVQSIRGDGMLVLRTPKGKIHVVDPGDPALRAASWIERLRFRERFARAAAHALEGAQAGGDGST